MTASLDRLERDVEEARARFIVDAGRFDAPESLDAAKEVLLGQAIDCADEALGRSRLALASAVQSALGNIRTRIEQNPAAALVICAGLAWRLARRPPVATLLVAAGTASLIASKRPATASPTPTTDALVAAGAALSERATQLAGRVEETARRTHNRASRAVQTIRKAAPEAEPEAEASGGRALGQAAAIAGETLDYASEKAALAGRLARENPFLWGLAALVGGVAIGLALQPPKGGGARQGGAADEKKSRLASHSAIFRHNGAQ